MKNWKQAGILALLVASLSWILRDGRSEERYSQPPRERGITQRAGTASPPAGTAPVFHRSISAADFADMTFTPWDVEAASAAVTTQPLRDHTVMIYMNGSDLESEGGAATNDLIEMLESGVDTSRVNIVIFTGGTNRWRNDVIPEDECALWQITDGALAKLTGVGLRNMGDPGTLTSFIGFCRRTFPARSDTLLFWDHGGGSIAGYGHDEKFENGRLSLLSLNYAFEQAGLAEKPLETIGFDACLMATVEMGVIASRYARYLVASEDLEPGDGWDYRFLSALNGGVNVNGAALGRVIVDTYIDFYGEDTPENVMLSVTDLSETGRVMGAMDTLMEGCSRQLVTDRPVMFPALAKRRYDTKTFGEGSPRDNECDMVDIGQMARTLSDLFPEEAGALLTALETAVIYNRYDSDVEVYGLAAYYLFGGKDNAGPALQTYADLRMSPAYTEYLHAFADNLTGHAANRGASAGPRSGIGTDGALHLSEQDRDNLTRVQVTLWKPAQGNTWVLAGLNDLEPRFEKLTVPGDTLWPCLEGQPICLYEIYRCDNGVAYAAPAEINGKKSDLIVFRRHGEPGGKLLGARQQDGYMIQKGLDAIREGDRIALCYETSAGNADRAETDWYVGETITIGPETLIEWDACAEMGDIHLGFRITDLWQDVFDVN